MPKLSSNEYETVLAFFEKALEQEPEKQSYWYDIGFCKGKLGKWDEAVKALEKAAAGQKNDPVIFNLLGHACIKTKNYEGAADALKMAVKLRPNSPKLLYKLSAAYFGLGQLEAARSTLEKILKLNPKFCKANFGVGLVSYYLNDESGYREQISILNKCDPDLSQKLAGLAEKNTLGQLLRSIRPVNVTHK